MTFINRTNADALIVPEVAQGIISDVSGGGSRILPLFTQLPNLASHTRTIKVLSAMPTAYFVAAAATDQEPGMKSTSAAAWDKVTLTAEELAVIVPIPEQIIDDADYDIWGQVKPLLVEAFGKAIDAAILHGTNAPASWPTNLVAAALAASNAVSEEIGDDLYDALLGEDGVFAAVEADGFMVRSAVGAVPLMAKLRGLRSQSEGLPIFKRDMQSGSDYTLDGVPVQFPDNGALNPAAALLVAGDFAKYVYAMRQDITYKVLTEATIYDSDGTTPLYALAQQDMVALRAVMRVGWAAPDPIKQSTSVRTGCPVGVLLPDSSS